MARSLRTIRALPANVQRALKDAYLPIYGDAWETRLAATDLASYAAALDYAQAAVEGVPSEAAPSEPRMAMLGPETVMQLKFGPSWREHLAGLSQEAQAEAWARAKEPVLHALPEGYPVPPGLARLAAEARREQPTPAFLARVAREARRGREAGRAARARRSATRRRWTASSTRSRSS
jgi:hypothetical protein